MWAICEEKINAQAPANYAPRVKKVCLDQDASSDFGFFQTDDALLKALTQPRGLNPFNPFGPMPDAKISSKWRHLLRFLVV